MRRSHVFWCIGAILLGVFLWPRKGRESVKQFTNDPPTVSVAGGNTSTPTVSVVEDPTVSTDVGIVVVDRGATTTFVRPNSTNRPAPVPDTDFGAEYRKNKTNQVGKL